MIAPIRAASIRRIPIILPNSSKIRDGASRYFVRDDDAGELTGELRLFVEMFANCGIPVSYQVIPARLTPACAAFFLDMSSGYPGMIEFGQHGLHHQMWLGDREVARAFGPEQTLEDQTQTILDGLARMRALLGEHARIDTFTAPRHKFDGNTVRTAAAAGFKVFSAACYETPQHQLACAIGRALSASAIHHHGFSYNGRMRPEAPIIERSISIAADDGKRRRYAARSLESATRALGVRRTPVGMMFHHALYRGSDGRDAVSPIVASLGTHDRERFMLLGA